MSRLDEVEAEIADLDDSYSARTYTDGYADLARTLAAEVDELRGKLDVLRVAVPDVLPPSMSWKDALDGARAILYPKENGHG